MLENIYLRIAYSLFNLEVIFLIKILSRKFDLFSNFCKFYLNFAF